MSFKRAMWHSGLVYRRTCEQCNTTVQYMDDKLDFRPWFPDGFVYFPTCQKPLRHSESYAIEKRAPTFVDMQTGYSDANRGAQVYDMNIRFCSKCGNEFGEGERFCTQCGSPRR